MKHPTQEQLLNAAVKLDDAYPAVAAWLVRMAEQQAAEPAIEVEISPMSTGGTTATVWSHRLPVGTHKLYTHPAPTQQPVLVRDLAEILGATVPEVCDALAECGGPRLSTNMAVSGEEALAVAAKLKQAAQPVAEVKLVERGGNAGLATVIHEIYNPERERLQPGDKLYTKEVNATQTKRSVISAEQLEGMFHKLEKLDQNSWGYKWKEGWNAALRQAMDYAMPQVAEPVARIAELEETVRQLNRALRDATEVPTFMGEPTVTAVCSIFGFDEHGPLFRWNTHWAHLEKGTKLYTHPAPTQQPLTDVAIDSLYQHMAADERTKPFTAQNWFQAGVAMAEAAHGITGSN